MARYVNVVTGQEQRRPPPDFRGGLLVDAPGLGKTLSMISLLALSNHGSEEVINAGMHRSPTLLVVPKTCE